MPTGAAALPAVLVPAGASGSAGGAATAAAVPEADTPSSLADQPAHGSMHLGLRPASREGSGRHAITITADGSGRGGRAFFDTPGSSRPGSRADTRDARWHQAVAEESALEAHSLQHGPHPAAAAGRGPTEGPHTGTANGAPPPAGPGKQPGGGDDGSGKGGDSGGGGGGTFGRKDAFEGATVLIEEAEERKYFSWAAYWGSLPKKLKGGLDTRLPIPSFRDIFWSWLGAFLGILAVCAMNQWVTPEIDIAFVVGSFGASAVLVFALLESKMSQPRNFLGGQMLSAVVGITTRVIIHQTWIAGPVGMSLALVVMQLTATTHPPGGATALIAATLPTLPKWHGYSYLVTISVGSCIMQIIALIVNNLDPKRRYPTYWY
ncbi:hypothetical protein COHA_001358 [Chlorella ohadii]|uniref:HPP transmembrane region domain-containing protein n=1 Tax=Chlorella ohadii TaxID=2649997 RepID=A0AAD5DWL9_9CHLO|nr:hypothetical protein COHA_001358 [Chlorella ohadii]